MEEYEKSLKLVAEAEVRASTYRVSLESLQAFNKAEINTSDHAHVTG